MAEPEPRDPDEVGQAVIVGVQRCGTTSVARTLAGHPQVAFAEPLRPEPKFFLQGGSAHRRQEYLDRHYRPGDTAVRLRCEKSTSYFQSDGACDAIAEAFPEARIVVVVRDPIARALSHYAFSSQSGLEDLPLHEALDLEAEQRAWDTDAVSVSPYRYLSRGRYVDDLGRWDRTFGAEAVHIVVLEELQSEPQRFADLEAALGLAPEIVFEPARRHNAGGETITLDDDTRSRLAAWFADANLDLAERLGRPLDRWTHA